MDRGSQLDEDDEDDEDDKDDKEDEEEEERRTRQEEAEEEEEQEEEATDIKSNNPHLAGGEQYTLQKVACRLTNLHLKMFCKNPKSPWVHWAHLGAKGGECKHLAPCLLPVLKDLLDNSKEEHPHLVACLESMVQLNEILDSCDLFLKDAEFDAFFGLAKGFVEEYSWLHGHFEEQGRPLFHIVNKSHTFLHWSWEAYFINPRAHTCWKGEDFVGQMAKLGHSVSFGVRTTRLSQKLMAKYQILLHLLYTREPSAFDILEDDGA